MSIRPDITPEKVAELYQSGKSIRTIASELSTNYNLVSLRLSRSGCPVRKCGRQKIRGICKCGKPIYARSMCARCFSSHHYHTRKEQRIAQAKRWKQAHPEKSLLASARDRAKKSGLDCTITANDIIIPEHCPVLGIKLEKNTSGRPGARNASPSLDRFDNSKGYTPENIQVISFRANSLKKDATLDEILKLAEYMKQHTPVEV